MQMEKLGQKLMQFRVSVRRVNSTLINNLIEDHNTKACVFCGEARDLTSEHVVPKWVFDSCPKKTFTTSINNQQHTYNKTTVWACRTCNNDRLGYFERYLVENLKEFANERIGSFDTLTYKHFIRWFEVLDYKFQVHNLQNKFLKHKESQYIPYLRDFPIAMFRNDAKTPSKVYSNLRKAHKKLGTKCKDGSLNSLVIFRSKNPGFNFLHTVNDFAFLEIPKYNIAFYFFYNMQFDSADEAYHVAFERIKALYEG